MADNSVSAPSPVESYELPLDSSPAEQKKLAETLLKLAPQCADFMRIARDGIRPDSVEDAKIAKIAAWFVLSAMTAFLIPEGAPR
jgi:hypothetical protein